MRKFLYAVLIVATLPIPAAFADIYMKSEGINGLGLTDTWTSGKKRRMVTHVSVPGLADQTDVQITRLDKGVEWAVDDSLRAYQEKIIALPASKSETPEAFDKEAVSGPDSKWVTLPKEEEDFCDPQLRVLPEKRILAGFSATGYEAICPNSGQSTLWMAPPEGVLKKFEKENNAFESGYQDELYKNYSAAEKKMTKELFGAFGQAGASLLIGVRPDKLPKHVPLRLDQVAQMADGSMGQNTLINILEISDEKADAALFEIPEGYRKVENLAEMQNELIGKQVAESMGMSGMAEALHDYGHEIERQDVPRAAHRLGNLPPEDAEEAPELDVEANDFDASSYAEESQG